MIGKTRIYEEKRQNLNLNMPVCINNEQDGDVNKNEEYTAEDFDYSDFHYDSFPCNGWRNSVLSYLQKYHKKFESNDE